MAGERCTQQMLCASAVQLIRLPIDIWKIVLGKCTQQMLLVTKWPAPVKGNRPTFAPVAAILACSVVTEVK